MTVQSSAASSVTEISPQQFLRLQQRPTLIDVRTGLEYLSGHAPEARNLSLDRLLIGTIPALRRWFWPNWLKDIPIDQPIAVICLTSHRSPIAAGALAKAGFTQVLNISGGMMCWQKLGLKVQKGK